MLLVHTPATFRIVSRVAVLVAVVGFCSLPLRSVANSAEPGSGERPQRPNVVLIVADDLGFSDLGVFGGEINTPHLDALARRGVQLTDFHVAPTCSPTRSMLLTGTDNHTAGVGAMAESGSNPVLGNYGYEGRLTDRVATLAERLTAAGYATLMSGKWHLGTTPDSIPSARGFQQSFALLEGGHNHFGRGGFGPPDSRLLGASYLDDGEPVTLGEDFYSSDDFTSQLLAKIGKVDKKQPFFAYLAFTAPHAPLQAPAELIRKYRGVYDGGWMELRQQRLERMKALGLIADDVIPHPVVPDAEAWQKLTPAERVIESRKMEVYAAMVERLDWNVGRLVAELKRRGEYDNTLFIFFSDNGPAGETSEMFAIVPGVAEYHRTFDNSLDNIGAADSFVFYGKYWAQAASAPFRLSKGVVTEGGVRVPAIVAGPGIAAGSRSLDARANVMDILPTVLELTGTPALAEVDGRTVAPIRGESMHGYLAGQAPAVHEPDEPFAFELHGQRSVRQGDWKLVWLPAPLGYGKWELFNLANDPAERVELSEAHPQRLQQMVAAWTAWADEVKVIRP